VVAGTAAANAFVKRSTIGGCRTFFGRRGLVVAGPTIGGCRTFFGITSIVDGFHKPESVVACPAYKAYIKAFSVKAKMSGLRPACYEKNI
jgi:hypothetical protein